jgi:hypothetical protein
MQSLLPRPLLYVFDDGHLGLLTAADDLVSRSAPDLPTSGHSRALTLTIPLPKVRPLRISSRRWFDGLTKLPL